METVTSIVNEIAEMIDFCNDFSEMTSPLDILKTTERRNTYLDLLAMITQYELENFEQVKEMFSKMLGIALTLRHFPKVKLDDLEVLKLESRITVYRSCLELLEWYE